MSGNIPTDLVVGPAMLRQTVEWLANRLNGVSMCEWDIHSNRILAAAKQLESRAPENPAFIPSNLVGQLRAGWGDANAVCLQAADQIERQRTQYLQLQHERDSILEELVAIKRTREQERDYASVCYENERLRNDLEEARERLTLDGKWLVSYAETYGKLLTEFERLRDQIRRMYAYAGPYLAGFDESAVETSGDFTDTQRIEFLEGWVADSRKRGFKRDTFTFWTDPALTVREQLDQQIVAGMTEILKVTPPEKTTCRCGGAIVTVPGCAPGCVNNCPPEKASGEP